MKQRKIRIKKIAIENLKNVSKGEVVLDYNNRRKSNILGIYGQNGSGKTALIDAIKLLKLCLTGSVIPEDVVDFITVDEKYSRLNYEFELINCDGVYDIYYEFSLEKDFMASEDGKTEKTIPVIACEKLSYSYKGNNGEKLRKRVVFDTNTDEIFLPKAKYDFLVGDELKVFNELFAAKIIARRERRSFIFSEMFSKVIKKDNDYKRNRKSGKEYDEICYLMDQLVMFGSSELFIIGTENSGTLTFDVLLINYRIKCNEYNSCGKFGVIMDEEFSVPESIFHAIEVIIGNMNIVLQQLVPGLSLVIKRIADRYDKNNEKQVQFELFSRRNERQIPLRYESEGIKKIISILSLLISVYNDDSVTIAIDELDSGIFEYLLGEILKIMQEKGKGQLIFTSHNLRPLETLDKESIIFTTTNPFNRYIRMQKLKFNNNLRDTYFRSLIIEDQKEILYDPTNNSEIAFAFREAGDFSED